MSDPAGAGTSMRCIACGTANPDEARFCGACGGRLAPPDSCPHCHAPTRLDQRFCNACGGPLGAPVAEDAGARVVVTIVFADLVGSTALQERLDAESVRRFMDRYYGAMRQVVEAHGGTVTQLLGDGVKAVFGAPRVAEDDAIRAVRAAVGMQRAFRALAQEQSGVVGQTGLRVAVNTGEVIASEGSEVIGDPVNVAARLQEQARDGDVVIGESTRRLVGELVTLAPLGAFALKGRSETVAAYRVVSLERPGGASATPFVGRESELRRILAVYDAARVERRARLAVVLGSPGLGKSRVTAEVARRLGGDTIVLLAHCDAAGGATFAPLANALRALLGQGDAASGDAVCAAVEAILPEGESEPSRISKGIAALIAGTPAAPEETFFVVRRFLAALAAVRPVVLAIDDLQWAEPLLLDLTEHLVQWATDAPLFVLVAARPELRDVRSSLVTPGGVVAEVVTLAGLDAGAATRLAANVIGADDLPAAVAARVLATSEGNPLFVGELVRMLVQDGALKREGDRWTAGVELAQLEMPPTIQALLAARIERLRPEERTVLERAAVVGRQFSRAAVTALLPRELADLDRQLEALRRSELIEPDTGWFLGEPALRFHHLLIRDAAYRRLLKNKRAELHERFADWVSERVGLAVERDETLGWHLEQAHAHLGELGPLDAHGRALGERASRHLAAAGRRALARDDVPLAASLLGRAIDRLDAADPARAELALDWCEALLAAGEVGTAATAIDELGRFTGESPRLSAWHTCFVGQRAARADPQALRATADAVAAAAETLASAGDAAGEAKAHFVHAIALAALGRVGACEAALDRALAAARRGRGDRRRANAVLAGAPQAALWGPSPVTRASGRCLDVVRVLRITQGAPAVEAVALRCQGVLEALRGRSEAARRMIATSRRMVEELGITQQLLEADVFAGQIELIEGDAAAAERCLRPAYQGLREHGLGIAAAQAAALLGRALLAQDRAAEAETLSHESEALAGDDLRAAVAWRGVRAEALARRGDHAAAIEFARAAVEIAAATDALLDHADARLALAAALRAAGRGAEAAAEETRATSLWEAKGATLLAERARREGVRAVPAKSIEVPRPANRRVRPNAATANAVRLDAAIAARDTDALPTLFADRLEHHHHPTGTTYDREGSLFAHRALLNARDATQRWEPLATLGDSLALFRSLISASALTTGKFDIGAYERDELSLIEVDAQGRRCWGESFAADRLGDAVVRLYERYAEQLPDGPERVRATATARSVAVLVRERPDRWLFAPDVERLDHRTVGIEPVRGADAVVGAVHALLELMEESTSRLDDVMGLRPDALFVRWSHFGTDRASGGAFERRFCRLWIFGADGLITRWEDWEAEQDAEALASFDALTHEPEPARPTRRVRPNAATAHALRAIPAIEARDFDALRLWHSDTVRVTDHTIGVDMDLRETMDWWRLYFAVDLESAFRLEPVATLGDSLGLFRQSWTGSASAGPAVDVGAFERDQFALFELAEHRTERIELFDRERLGTAVVRLYERYAELLPAGPERARAAAIARSVAVSLQSDLDRQPAIYAPTVEFADYRALIALPPARGADELRQRLQTWLGTVERSEQSLDDVLALRSDAFLVRRTERGRDRASGGSFEGNHLVMHVFGVDGALERLELFDSDREAEALARFDAMNRTTARPARRVRANAVTAFLARLGQAIVARDTEALAALYADDAEIVDHTVGVSYERRELLTTYRAMLAARDVSYREEILATLGDSLALNHTWVSASGVASSELDVSAYTVEAFGLIEVDASGRMRRGERFAADRLGGAIVRLYERYAELLPAGPERTRAAATARAVAAWRAGPLDLDRNAAVLAPDVECVDHQTLGTWSGRGTNAVRENFGSWREIADDVVMHDHEVLALRSDALLVRRHAAGIDRRGGGAYENHFLMLLAFGAEGLLTQIEFFDPDRDADALARFDALTAEPPRRARRVRPNSATANAVRLDAAIAARDAEAFPCLYADDFELLHHPTGTSYDRQGALFTFRTSLRSQDLTRRSEPLATLGNSLSLIRISTSAAGYVGRAFDVGEYEREEVGVIEVDANGRRARAEMFAAGRLGDAIVRLYERYAERLPDGPERDCAAATARSVTVQMGATNPDRIATTLAPDIEFVDHRALIGLGSARGTEVIGAVHTWFEVVDDPSSRIDDVLALQPAALLVQSAACGTDRVSGGTFEQLNITLWVFGGDGLITRLEMFDRDREADALARFDALTAEPDARPMAAPRENAATRALARVHEAWRAHDRERLVALLAPDFQSIDRRRMVRAEVDRDRYLEFVKSTFTMHSFAIGAEVLATRGDRLALARVHIELADRAEAPPTRIAMLNVVEVDARGLYLAGVRFDADDLAAATAELDARAAAPSAATRTAPQIENAATRALERFRGAWHARDWRRIEEEFPADFRQVDRRKTVQLEMDRDQHLEWIHTAFEMAPSRLDQEPLATRGNRLVLLRSLIDLSDRDFGPSEIGSLDVLEVDDHGERVMVIRFDPDDLDAAYAELDARYAAGEAAAHPAFTAGMQRVLRAVAARDWDPLAAAFSPNAVLEDHRRVGWGTLSRGDEYAAMARSLVELRSDTVLRIDHVLALDQRGALLAGRWIGIEAEGTFEIPFVLVVESGRNGLIHGWHNYDPEQLDAARARFAELRTDPLQIPRNAATRFGSRLHEAIDADDWDAVAALCAPTLVFDDRRRAALLTGDREMYLASLRFMGKARRVNTVLATAGDRLALMHQIFRDASDPPTFEAETLSVIEVDPEGRIVASIIFDPDDRRAASIELLERSPRSAPPWVPRDLFELLRGVANHDLARCRAALPDDFVFEDHRRTGLGRVEGAEAYVASLAAVFEQSPDAIIEGLCPVAAERHGAIAVAHWFGHLAGGGEFESVFVQLGRYEAGRLAGVEIFEIDDLDRARARFEELRPDPLRIPPNAASRARDRIFEALAAKDWAAMRALMTDDSTFEDRGRQALVTGGVEQWIESVRFFQAEGGRPARELIGTAGDRIAIERVTWTSAPDGSGFEIEQLAVAEVDAAGRFRASIRFDADDRRAAFEEAQQRFVAGEAAGVGCQAAISAIFSSDGSRDWEVFRSRLTENAVIWDRRTPGVLGTLSRDEWVDSVRTLAELAPDFGGEILRIFAWNQFGRVHLARQFGTREGGPFETVFVSVFLTAGDRIQRYEIYDLDAADTALARFAELCGDRALVPADSPWS